MSQTIQSMTGPITIPEGFGLAFTHYARTILTLDLTHHLIAHHGYDGYSMTTNRNIVEYSHALAEHGLLPQDVLYVWRQWTKKTPMFVGSSGADARFDEFRKRAPWCIPDDSTPRSWWFHWPSFDEALADQYWGSERHLCRDQNWRYFTWEWDSAGRWARRFIGPTEEGRYQARERRRKRAGSGTLARVPGKDPMPTYRDLYTEHLLRTIEGGGSDEAMEAAVTEYNHLGSPYYGGSSASTKWMLETKLPCNTCQKEFVAPTTDDEGSSLSDEVVCPDCRAKTV